MRAAPTAASGTLPGSESKIAIQLGDDRLVAVGLHRVDEEGALVLSIPHPDILAPGRPVLVFWQRNDRWTPLPTRVGRPRYKPHPDTGRLRLVPESRPVDRTSVAPTTDGAGMPDLASKRGQASRAAEGSATADTAAAGGTKSERARTKPDGPAKSDGDFAAPGIMAWHGRHPTTNVALRLGSGRVRTIEVRRMDDDGALVLSLPRPSMLTDGTHIEVAWSERREWLTADVRVIAARPEGHADAGLLRLVPAGAPVEHKERRASLRYPIKVGVRGRVEKGAVRKGTSFASESLDLSEGGIAFACSLELARGDVIMARLLGPHGQLGDEVELLVRRVAPIPGSTDTCVAASFENPTKNFDRAVKRHILAFC